jgi:hypothetical protein
MNYSFLSMVSNAPRMLSATSARSALLDPVRNLHDGGFKALYEKRCRKHRMEQASETMAA